MKLDDVTTIAQLTDFLSGTQAVAFSVLGDKEACYRWLLGELVKFRYLTRGALSRQDRGVVIRYLMKVSGYSRQQITRLIQQYRQTGTLRRRHAGLPMVVTQDFRWSSAHRRWLCATVHARGYPPAGGDG